jgi:sulfur-carrier protein
MTVDEGGEALTVRVRLFAAVREAAGTAEVAVEPAPLHELLDGLRARFGEPFASRLALCTVLVDGSAQAATSGASVPDGAEVVLLPPVSGGAGRRPL